MANTFTQIDDVSKYVMNQKEHHRKKTLILRSAGAKNYVYLHCL
jgi:hypothetical protein